MRNFILGVIVGAVLLGLAAFCYVRFGFVNPRADIQEGSIEKAIAMPALDASVDRHAPELKNPVAPDETNLISGMKLYQTNCASCHGDVVHPHGAFAESFYPRAPPFAEDGPDMPEDQNFYIVQHGIQLSGMPAWEHILDEQQMWQITAFLSKMDKLPPEVAVQWKAAASTEPAIGSATAAPAK